MQLYCSFWLTDYYGIFRQLPTVTAGTAGRLHLLPTTPQYLRKRFVSEQECLFGLEMQLQPSQWRVCALSL
jgi:hypothetical protein